MDTLVPGTKVDTSWQKTKLAYTLVHTHAVFTQTSLQSADLAARGPNVHSCPPKMDTFCPPN
eukprot:2207556-Prymnesium_polylepis.1